jgi:hypothetical protein
LYILRGENVVLLGEIDVTLEEGNPSLHRVSYEEILEAERLESEAAGEKEPESITQKKTWTFEIDL